MNLFKMIGATEDQVVEDWEHKESHIFMEIRFPWNKPPTEVWSPGRVIVYAVGSGALIATQIVDGPPSIKPRRGPAGSRDDRWPHEIKVKTLYYCSPLSTAPMLREVSPKFADKYRKRFRNGSHWQITDEEYQVLADAIEGAGRPISAHGSIGLP
jgi:hypothetical protein